jgi:hypothetical protein
MASEHSDVDVRAIFMFGAGLAGLTAVVSVVVWLFFVYLTRQQDRAAAPPSFPLAAEQADRMPPEPRLQTNPRQDLRDLRAAEAEVLNSYRWVDRNAGTVRIPIEEAIRLTVERGLPSRASAAEAAK